VSCELGVHIVPGDAKCLLYRRSANDTCRGCLEFAAAVVESVDEGIRPVEVIEMAKKAGPKRLRKGDKFTCPECKRDNAAYESGGLCGVCNAKRRKEKLAAKAAELPTGPVSIPSAVYPDLDADAAEVSACFGKVTNADSGAVSSVAVDDLLLQLIDYVLRDVRRVLLVEVSGMSVTAGARHVLREVERIAVRAAL
jgi:hypothetical protein